MPDVAGLICASAISGISMQATPKATLVANNIVFISTSTSPECGDASCEGLLITMSLYEMRFIDVGAGTPVLIRVSSAASPLIMLCWAGRRGPDHSPSMPRILLIEDDAGTAEEIRLELRRREHEVAWSRGGHEALEMAHDRFDAMIVDRLLPGLEGLGRELINDFPGVA